MVVDVEKSVDELKMAVEAFERLRLGLRPVVEDIVANRLPKQLSTATQLWDLSHPPGAVPREDEEFSGPPDTVKHMDIAAILSLMGNSRDALPPPQKNCYQEFEKQFRGASKSQVGFVPGDLIKKRNTVAHYRGKENLRPCLEEVLKTACTWLQDVASRYTEAEDQLEKLKDLRSKVERSTPKQSGTVNQFSTATPSTAEPDTESSTATRKAGSGGRRAGNSGNRNRQPSVVENRIPIPAEIWDQVAAAEESSTVPPARPTTTR